MTEPFQHSRAALLRTLVDPSYWLGFFDGRWLVYRDEQLIGDLPGESAALALAFLRQKQEEQLQAP